MSEELQPAEAPEPSTVARVERSESDLLSEAYDRITGAQPRDESGRFAAKAEAPADGDNEVEAEEPAQEAEEPEAAPLEAPSWLPQTLKEQWADVPEHLRPSIADAHMKMSQKLAEMGKRDAAIRPIYEATVRAAQSLPSMADMTPQQIADGVYDLALTQVALQQDPIGTIWTVAGRLGVQEQLRAALSGQQPQQQAQAYEAKIAELEKRLSEATDPSRFQSMIDERLSSRSVEDVVTSFAAEKEHWAEAESLIPGLIPAVQARLGEDAAPSTVLSEAYEMALKALGLKVTAPKHDPAKVEAAKRAKSVNVSSKSNGDARPKTEQELLSETYDRLMAS